MRRNKFYLGHCPESGRLLESARSARFSEIYGMSARSIKSLDIVIENNNSIISEESDKISTLTEISEDIDKPEFINQIINDMINQAIVVSSGSRPAL